MSQTETVLTFDIETIPDLELLRRHYGEPEANLEQLAEIAQQEALEKSDGRSDFLPVIMHQVVAISVVLRTADKLIIKSRVVPESSEKEAVEKFFGLIDKYRPVLVSWNGNGFDLPVLNLRALRHNIVAETYWSGPDGDKWNQYTSRYHGAHQDVMDLLAQFNARSNSKLELTALSCGLPGKLGYGGDQVLPMYLNQQYHDIGKYCELDTLNTYLLWLRFRQLAGKLTPQHYTEECTLVEQTLTASKEEHHKQFLEQWLEHRN